MVKIAPSILNAPPLKLPEALQKLRGADLLHLDMMDGHFVPSLTFGPWLAGAVVAGTRLPVEAHLMVSNPETHLEALATVGCRRVYVHVEATPHLHRLISEAKRIGLQAGAALNPGTPISALEPILGEIDAVLVMSVDPGWGGQAFWPGSLTKTRGLRDMGFEGEIELDGGIDPRTAPAALAAGATILVVGSFLFSGDSPDRRLEEVRRACAEEA